MNKLIVLAVIAASALVATAAWPQQGAFQATRYFESPLEKDPTRMVRLQSEFMPPGSGNAFHRHPGDQWSAVQEGEVTFTIKGHHRACSRLAIRFTCRAAPSTATRTSPTSPRAQST